MSDYFYHPFTQTTDTDSQSFFLYQLFPEALCSSSGETSGIKLFYRPGKFVIVIQKFKEGQSECTGGERSSKDVSAVLQ